MSSAIVRNSPQGFDHSVYKCGKSGGRGPKFWQILSSCSFGLDPSYLSIQD